MLTDLATTFSPVYQAFIALVQENDAPFFLAAVLCWPATAWCLYQDRKEAQLKY